MLGRLRSWLNFDGAMSAGNTMVLEESSELDVSEVPLTIDVDKYGESGEDEVWVTMATKKKKKQHVRQFDGECVVVESLSSKKKKKGKAMAKGRDCIISRISHDPSRDNDVMCLSIDKNSTTSNEATPTRSNASATPKSSKASSTMLATMTTPTSSIASATPTSSKASSTTSETMATPAMSSVLSAILASSKASSTNDMTPAAITTPTIGGTHHDVNSSFSSTRPTRYSPNQCPISPHNLCPHSCIPALSYFSTFPSLLPNVHMTLNGHPVNCTCKHKRKRTKPKRNRKKTMEDIAIDGDFLSQNDLEATLFISSSSAPLSATLNLPSWWSDSGSKSTSSASFSVTDLDITSREAKLIMAPLINDGFKVTVIQRIQSPSLWRRYMGEVRLFLEERGEEGFLNEKLLYHCSRAKKEIICAEGLDLRLSNEGHFGKGIYFR